MTSIKTESAEAVAKRNAAEQQRKDLINEIARLQLEKKKFDGIEVSLADKREELNQANDELSQAIHERSGIHAELAELTGRRTALESQVRDIDRRRADASAVEKSLKDLRDNLAGTVSELKQMRKDSRGATQERDGALAELAKLGGYLVENKRRLDAANQDLITKTKETEAAEKRRKLVYQRLGELRAERDVAERQIEDATRRRIRLAEEIGRLEARNEWLTLENQKLKTESDKLKREEAQPNPEEPTEQ